MAIQYVYKKTPLPYSQGHPRRIIRVISQAVTGGVPVPVSALSIGLRTITAVLVDAVTPSGFAAYVECLAGSSATLGASAVPPVLAADGSGVILDHTEGTVAHRVIVLVEGIA